MSGNFSNIQKRKLLYENVEEILVSLNARRGQNKNQTNDLFSLFGGGYNSSEQNKLQLTPKNTVSDLDILMAEKNALGVYLSHNPMTNYKEMEVYFQKMLQMDNIFLVLVEKYKRVFTKKGTMMIALELTTTSTSLEGVIFSSQALRLLPVLEEKKIYWVLGSISGGKDSADRAKGVKEENKEPAPVKKIDSEELEEAETDSENSEPGDGEAREEQTTNLGLSEDSESAPTAPEDSPQKYEEKPKMLINEIIPAEDGLKKMVENAEKIRYKDKILKKIPNINWSKLISSGQKWRDIVIQEYRPEDEIKNFVTDLVSVYLSPKLGSKLALIKNSLKKTLDENAKIEEYFPAEVWIEKDGEFKKAKGQFWIKQDIYEIYQHTTSGK